MSYSVLQTRNSAIALQQKKNRWWIEIALNIRKAMEKFNWVHEWSWLRVKIAWHTLLATTNNLTLLPKTIILHSVEAGFKKPRFKSYHCQPQLFFPSKRVTRLRGQLRGKTLRLHDIYSCPTIHELRWLTDMIKIVTIKNLRKVVRRSQIEREMLTRLGLCVVFVYWLLQVWKDKAW